MIANKKEISGWERYSINTSGFVTNTKTGRTLKCHYNSNGYAYVTLRIKPRFNRVFMHRMVATAFIPNPFNKPCVNHINGIKHDNRVENLEWCTVAENRQHALITGLSGKLSIEKAEKIRLLYKSNTLSVHEIAELFNIGRSTVYRVKNNRIWLSNQKEKPVY